MLTKVNALKADSLKLIGQLYLPGEGAQTLLPTVCLCHGIPGNSPDPNDRGYSLLAERICRQNFAVFIFNFRGAGASGGNFDILDWTEDLKVVIDYLWTLPEVDRSRLLLLGFSGGAAVSIYVASQDKRVSSIVTCACPAEFTFFTEGNEPQSIIDHFRSVGIIRDKNFPHSAHEWLHSFTQVSPVNYIAGIAPRPLLLVHGSQDETVEVSHAYKLYDRAGEPKQIVIVDGAGHGLRQNDKVMAIVLDWLKTQCQN
ncbi:hypothetical protein ES703_54104 [subsurface metagenome]